VEYDGAVLLAARGILAIGLRKQMLRRDLLIAGLMAQRESANHECGNECGNECNHECNMNAWFDPLRRNQRSIA